MLLLPVFALAEAEEEEVEIGEIIDAEVSVEESEEEPEEETAPKAGEWTFPVALEDMDPTFVVLANKHYKLDSKFVPKPLVKMKQRKANKDGSNKNGGVLFAKGGTYKLQETCAEALVAMSEGARADGYNLYLKSAYRSYQTQKTMYNNRLKKNKGKDDGWVSQTIRPAWAAT